VPLPVQQIMQAVFSIDEVTTFRVQVRLHCALNCAKKFVKLHLLSHVLHVHLHGSCGLHHHTGYMFDLYRSITLRAMVKDITVAGS